MTTLPTLSAAVIGSDRVVLRKARDDDREGIVEVMTDPEVRAYLGGPRPREGVERFLDASGTASATAAAGSYVIADRQTGRFVGVLGLARRAVGRPGRVTGEGGELELSYVLRRGAWGAGLAFEAAAAALRAAAGELPDQTVLVVTQSANDRARRLADRLGFREVSQFEEFGAEQVLAVASLGSFRASLPAGVQRTRVTRPSGDVAEFAGAGPGRRGCTRLLGGNGRSADLHPGAPGPASSAGNRCVSI